MPTFEVLMYFSEYTSEEGAANYLITVLGGFQDSISVPSYLLMSYRPDFP